MNEIYDVVIIGAGPAGLTASLYCSCFHLSHIVIGTVIGGQMTLAPDIVNYPGFSEISGKELTKHMVNQVKGRGGAVIESLVTRIRKIKKGFVIKTENGGRFRGRVVILATGTQRKKLNVKGETQYAVYGGVHYCATCQRQDYRGKRVAVIGGGNSAVQAAVQLAHAAAHVYLLCRGSELSCHAIWAQRLGRHTNIEIRYDTRVTEILGDNKKVTGIKITANKKPEVLPVEKVFVEIGGVPGTVLALSLGVAVDKRGYIVVNEKLETNAPGVFAAGDLVTYGLSIEQISTAVGLGARAAASAFSYLKAQKAPTSWGQALIKR